MLGVCNDQVSAIPTARAQSGINFHSGVRCWWDVGVINIQLSAAPNIIAFRESRSIAVEQFSSESFKYAIG